MTAKPDAQHTTALPRSTRPKRKGVSGERPPNQHDFNGRLEAVRGLKPGKNGQIKVEWLKPGLLKPYPNNAMIHTEAQIEQVASSIRRFGFTVPILVDERNMILAGHARLKAADKLELR